MTREKLAAIRARVEAADRDDPYPLSYTGASNVDLYRHPQVRADMRALLAAVARLAAEVERLSAMAPRWVGNERIGLWNLTVGTALPLGSVEHFNPNGPFIGWVPTRDDDGDTYVSAEADLPTACAAVCRQLGLPDINPPETP